jgi:hypothetical protein
MLHRVAAAINAKIDEAVADVQLTFGNRVDVVDAASALRRSRGQNQQRP